jgi:hypothetical protein
MATRMQQRRGTASQWTSANPILNAGEMGWESDTNKFKIGDGTNHWADLDYFIDVNSTVNPAFGSSITFEGATADSFETILAVTDPTADRTITFPDATGTVALTSDIAELSQDAIDTALTAGTGITKTYNDAANTLTIAVDTTAIQARVTDVSDTEIGYLNGVTSAIQTQLDDKSTASKTETLTNKTLTTPTINGPTITDTGQTPTIHGIYLPAPHTIIFEGTTANDFETTLTAGEPTGDRTITLPDATGTVALVANVAALSGATFTGAVSGTDLTLSGNLTVNGTTTNINSTNLVVEDKNIVLGDTETPTDTTADGGGITLKGATDKTLNWVDATDAWTSSEDFNLLTGKVYEINGTSVLSGTTLGSGVTGSSLTSVGTITSGTWTGTTIAIANGGTGATTASNAAAALLPAQASNSGKYLTTDGSGTLSWGTVSGYSAPTLGSTSIASGATVTTIAGLTLTAPVATTSLTLNDTAELRLADTDSTHYVGFKSPATVSTNKIWTLPSVDGTAGQVLSTNGSATLSWATAGGGADTNMVVMGAY